MKVEHCDHFGQPGLLPDLKPEIQTFIFILHFFNSKMFQRKLMPQHFYAQSCF
jgi:hypothetical protein